MKSKFICLFTIATLAGSTGALKAAVFTTNPLRKSDAAFVPGDFSAESSFVSPAFIAAASGERPADGADVMKKSSSKKSSSKKSSSKKSSSKAS